jgi:hypothetical protein
MLSLLARHLSHAVQKAAADKAAAAAAAQAATDAATAATAALAIAKPLGNVAPINAMLATAEANDSGALTPRSKLQKLHSFGGLDPIAEVLLAYHTTFFSVLDKSIIVSVSSWRVM